MATALPAPVPPRAPSYHDGAPPPPRGRRAPHSSRTQEPGMMTATQIPPPSGSIAGTSGAAGGSHARLRPGALRSAMQALVLGAALGLAAGCSGEDAAADAEASPTPAAAGAPGGPAATGAPGSPGSPAATPGAPGGQAFDTATLPAVVARIDGRDVTRRELLERAEAMRIQMRQMGAPAPPQTEEFYREMLDQVIGAYLLHAEAERRKLTPTAAQVAEQIQKLRARFPSEELYRQQLAAQGITEKDVEEDLARNLAIQSLVAADLGGPGPTEAEERRFYQENRERMQRPAQVRVRHILIGAGGDATPEQRQAARQEAVALRARILAGEDFAKLAGEASDDPGSRPQGGLLPWFGPGEMVPPFEKAALALEPGAVSDVVESPFGYHVIRLEERRAETPVPFEEARAQIRDLLARRNSRDALRATMDALRRDAMVEGPG